MNEKRIKETIKKITPQWWNIGAVFTCFGLVYGQYSSLSSKLDDDIRMQTQRIDQANARTDQLYTMFIDMLKEGRK